MRGLDQYLRVISFHLNVHFGQRSLHLCIRIKGLKSCKDMFNFKCITEYSVEFLYQIYDVLTFTFLFWRKISFEFGTKTVNQALSFRNFQMKASYTISNIDSFYSIYSLFIGK